MQPEKYPDTPFFVPRINCVQRTTCSMYFLKVFRLIPCFRIRSICLMLLSVRYALISALSSRVSLSRLPGFLPDFLLLAAIPSRIRWTVTSRSFSARSNSTVIRSRMIKSMVRAVIESFRFRQSSFTVSIRST